MIRFGLLLLLLFFLPSERDAPYSEKHRNIAVLPVLSLPTPSLCSIAIGLGPRDRWGCCTSRQVSITTLISYLLKYAASASFPHPTLRMAVMVLRWTRQRTGPDQHGCGPDLFQNHLQSGASSVLERGQVSGISGFLFFSLCGASCRIFWDVHTWNRF